MEIINKIRQVCIYSLSFENLASSLVVLFLANQVSGMCAQAPEWNLAVEKDWSQEDEYEAWGQVLAVMFDDWAKEGWAYAVKKWQWASGISLCLGDLWSNFLLFSDLRIHHGWLSLHTCHTKSASRRTQDWNPVSDACASLGVKRTSTNKISLEQALPGRVRFSSGRGPVKFSSFWLLT